MGRPEIGDAETQLLVSSPDPIDLDNYHSATVAPRRVGVAMPAPSQLILAPDPVFCRL